jgi:hypothetical protein
LAWIARLDGRWPLSQLLWPIKEGSRGPCDEEAAIVDRFGGGLLTDGCKNKPVTGHYPYQRTASASPRFDAPTFSTNGKPSAGR